MPDEVKPLSAEEIRRIKPLTGDELTNPELYRSFRIDSEFWLNRMLSTVSILHRNLAAEIKMRKEAEETVSNHDAIYLERDELQRQLDEARKALGDARVYAALLIQAGVVRV